MYQSSALLRQNYQMGGSSAYLANEVLEATPEKLLLKVYDYAIAKSMKGDLENTNKALSLLGGALRFEEGESKEISIGLKRLYDFCQDQMRNKNYELVNNILTELRESWLKIFK